MDIRRPQEVPQYQASGAERLAQLATFADDLAPSQFNLSCWYSRGKGCAVGLAAANEPWFQAQGLRLEAQDSLKDCRPVYQGAKDWDAVAAFFEISLTEARQLFQREAATGGLHPDPKRIVAKIRAFLAEQRVAVA